MTVGGTSTKKLVAEQIRVHFEGVKAVDGIDLETRGVARNPPQHRHVWCRRPFRSMSPAASHGQQRGEGQHRTPHRDRAVHRLNS